MTPDIDTLSKLRRPRLLVRAARLGLADYLRDRDLRRVFAASSIPPQADLVAELLKREAALDERRRNGNAGYSIARHVHLLTVIMAEARGLMHADAAGPIK